jgi:hypothetical protein
LFRQAGFVNLWFFLKVIAGNSGPFNLLNSSLHLDMCNVRMDQEKEHARFAAFLPRKVYKSTIFTEGATAWSALRNPDKTHAVFCCTNDMAVDFLHTIQRIYDSNEMFKWLYPEYVPEKNQKRWNDVEGCLPNLTRYKTDPTFAAYGVGCNTAGKHPQDMYIDDPVGDQQLNSDRGSSSEMYSIANWLKSNLRTLTQDANSSIYYCGTRYAIDDAHAFIFESIKEQIGYWDELEDDITPTGEWTVYYHMVEEHGKIILPSAYTRELLDQTLKEDPWTYWTQMQNHPQKSGLAELNNYEVKECNLDYDENDGWIITFMEGQERKVVPLSSCDVVQAVDPAASEKKMSAKTSRSAEGLLAHHSSGKRFLLTLHADYVQPSVLFDWIFSTAKKFKDNRRGLFLETQGAFKLFYNKDGHGMLRDEEQRRVKEAIKRKEEPIYLHVQPLNKSGEKDSVIRATLEPVLQQGQLYVEKSIRTKVLEELNVFPNSRKKDILDMLAIALNASRQPVSEDEIEERNEIEDSFAKRVVNAAGY